MFYITNDMKPDHEMAFDEILSAMERGVRVDMERLNKMSFKLQQDVNSCATELRNRYMIDNPNSSVQVKNAFMQWIKPEDLKYCKVMGKVTFKKEVLVKLDELGYEIATRMLEYRKAKKTLESLVTLKDNCDAYGLIHPEVERGITNRFNYSKPALMNIPKAILWDIIIPYREDSALYSVDIKQQEPWILVNLLDIEELRDLIAVHKDFYAALFYAAFGEECNEEQRKEVKRAWNAMSYGASEQGILQYCTLFDGHTLYNYFNSIKEYKQFKGRAYGLAKKNCQRMNTYFGTTLYAGEYGSKLQRVLMNIPIQGTGSDILSFLIERFCDKIAADGYSELMQIYYTRHDELIIEVSNKVTEESCISYLRDVFEHQIDDWEPFNVEIEKVSADKVLENGDDETDE